VPKPPTNGCIFCSTLDGVVKNPVGVTLSVLGFVETTVEEGEALNTGDDCERDAFIVDDEGGRIGGWGGFLAFVLAATGVMKAVDLVGGPLKTEVSMRFCCCPPRCGLRLALLDAEPPGLPSSDPPNAVEDRFNFSAMSLRFSALDGVSSLL